MMYTKQTNNFDYSLLRKRMVEYRYNITSLVAAVGMDKGLLGAKLRNRTEFNQRQITKIAKVLDIDLREVPAYFFVSNVDKKSTKTITNKIEA